MSHHQLSDNPHSNPLQTLSRSIDMLPTTIRSPPDLGDYIPLEEYQSQTPETFFGGKPVLHNHIQGAKAWLPKDQCASLPIFTGDATPSPASAPAGASLTTAATDDLAERAVDVLVTSESLTIFSPETSTGIAIPYPAISIHAVKKLGTLSGGAPLQAIWMQLDLSDSAQDDDDPASIDLTIVPPASADGGQADVQKLYDAISACSDLHPDPAGDEDSDDDDRIVFEGEHEQLDGFTGVLRGAADGGLPPPFPGSSGWITAENVHEYFDQDGNWIKDGEEGEEGVSGELGEGAGRVRTRDEVNGHEGANAEEDTENKRPRVDDPAAP